MANEPRHRIHAGALADLNDAIAYLMREAPEQAPRLRMVFDGARKGLRQHPLIHGSLYEDYRRAVLVPFKYMIVYVTDGRSTDILAVLNAVRDPAALLDELTTRTFE